MELQNKSYDQFILVIATDESKKTNNAQEKITVAAKIIKKPFVRVVFARETEAEVAFDRAYSVGEQPIAVFFVGLEEVNESLIEFIRKIYHKDPSINIIFLVDSDKEDTFSSSLPQYALMGINYSTKAIELSEIKGLLTNISHSATLRRRQRTALSNASINISNVPLGQDVLEYQKYETQERYLRSILPMMNIAVIATDSEGEIELWNKKAGTYFGIEARDAVGSKISDISTDSWRTVLGRIEKKMKNSNVPSLRFKNELLKLQPKSEFIADIYYSYLMNEDGQKIGMLYLIEDVTLMVEVDRAKTEFVSLAAHQLQTPTSTINWFAQTLLKEKVTGELSVSQKEYISQIEESSRRMSKLVNTLLDISRLELGTFVVEPVNVNIKNLLDGIIQSYTKKAKNKKIVLEQNISRDIPDSVMWDPSLIHIMVENLISNAIKYTPENGKITLHVERSKDAVMGDSVFLSVSDTGYGIPKNQQRNIFTKLFRADNIVSKDTDGTGLGLYLVKIISDHIGAKVWFESPAPIKQSKNTIVSNKKHNPGTIFYLTVPLRLMKSKKSEKHLGE